MSKNLQNIAYKAIHKQLQKLGLILDQKGYLKKSEDNILQIVNEWSTIKNELSSGQGSELKPNKNGVIKFNAAHSSSALCVNNFAHFKEYPHQSSLLQFRNFEVIQFEKKLHTGISKPNLDLYLETSAEVIGVESKFTEHLCPKKPNKNLDKYINRSELVYLPSSFNEILWHYIDEKRKYYLDVAQLIKHAIGLRRTSERINSKKPVLVYIYWLPENSHDFAAFHKHQNEINEFQARISKFVDFYHLSYIKYWSSQELHFPEIVASIKQRYLVNI